MNKCHPILDYSRMFEVVALIEGNMDKCHPPLKIALINLMGVALMEGSKGIRRVC